MPIKSTILGISPGTRRIGFAVLKRGKLVHWEIRTFNAAWSNKKASHMAHTIQRYINRYNIDCIALKVNHPARTSNGLEHVVYSIIEIADKSLITLNQYSIAELNAGCSFNETPCKNKSILASSILHKYPDLIREYRRVCTDGKLYYMKVFEAAACAYCSSQK
jgi:hypothetical protein